MKISQVLDSVHSEKYQLMFCIYYSETKIGHTKNDSWYKKGDSKNVYDEDFST